MEMRIDVKNKQEKNDEHQTTYLKTFSDPADLMIINAHRAMLFERLKKEAGIVPVRLHGKLHISPLLLESTATKPDFSKQSDFNAFCEDIEVQRTVLLEFKKHKLLEDVEFRFGSKGRLTTSMDGGGEEVTWAIVNFYPKKLLTSPIKTEQIFHSRSSDSITLNFTKDFSLYRESKIDISYSFLNQKNPLKIFQYLLSKDHREYIGTAKIAEDLGMKPKQLRTDIGKLRRSIKQKLRLQLNIIDGKQELGYRLHPRINVIEVNTF